MTIILKKLNIALSPGTAYTQLLKAFDGNGLTADNLDDTMFTVQAHWLDQYNARYDVIATCSSLDDINTEITITYDSNQTIPTAQPEALGQTAEATRKVVEEKIKLIFAHIKADAPEIASASSAPGRIADAPPKRALTKAELAKQGKRKMLSGMLWAIGGCLVTVITYSMASNAGGRYFVVYGAIVWGVINFFIGLSMWLKNRKTDA